MVRAFNFFGVAAGAGFLLVAVAGGAAAKKTVEVVHSFTGTSGADGRSIQAPLLLDSDGTVYGTTVQGGTTQDFGTIFKIAPNGTETLLHSFAESEGNFSTGGLVKDDAGNIFGTLEVGGAFGHGSVFELAPNGDLTVIHPFAGGTDGEQPQGTLVRDKKGNLYGTTQLGGADGFGTAFQLTPDGKEKTIYAFAGLTDGARPLSGLIADRKNNLYGTASTGGTVHAGVVFKLTRGAHKHWTQTVLYSFLGGSDSGSPAGNLVMDKAGNLYGITTGNACFSGGVCGTVFRLAPNGVETVLHSFATSVGQSDGAVPTSIAMDRKGNIYGTTEFGGGTLCGGNGCGLVFEISAGGDYRVLYALKGTDGSEPWALVRNPAGDLIGGSNLGGTANDGVIFKIAH